jgi:hypothetical protein
MNMNAFTNTNRLIKLVTLTALMSWFALPGVAAVLNSQAPHGPTFPPNPWCATETHGPTFPPNPWCLQEKHGPTFPPNPWTLTSRSGMSRQTSNPRK